MEISTLASEPHPRVNKGAVVGVPQEQIEIVRAISRAWVPQTFVWLNGAHREISDGQGEVIRKMQL